MSDHSFYTLAASLPIMAITGTLLFANLGKPMLIGLCVLCATVGIVAFAWLTYDLSNEDVRNKKSVWYVLYLIIYLISAFTFIYVALSLSLSLSLSSSPGRAVFQDALYTSLRSYIGSPLPEETRTMRFLTVGQGVVSMLLNVFIIAKIVRVM